MRTREVARRPSVRLAIAVGCVAALAIGGCSSSATRTDGAGPIENSDVQLKTRCTYVKEYQLWVYTADLQINGSKAATNNTQVADGLKGAGVKLQGAVPEFSSYVSALTNDRVARLTGATPPSTTVNLEDARQIVGTFQTANCPETTNGSALPAAGAATPTAPAK